MFFRAHIGKLTTFYLIHFKLVSCQSFSCLVKSKSVREEDF
jgi:hypothetical protein